jgi:hypothetical protein
VVEVAGKELCESAVHADVCWLTLKGLGSASLISLREELRLGHASDTFLTVAQPDDSLLPHLNLFEAQTPHFH